MLNLTFPLLVAGSFSGDFCEGLTATPAQIAQQGDGDIVVVITAMHGDTSQPVDLSAASDLLILVQKPDLTVLSYGAALTTNGKDGKLQVALGPSALDQAGYYKVQATFTVASIAKATAQGQLKVSETLVPTEGD